MSLRAFVRYLLFVVAGIGLANCRAAMGTALPLSFDKTVTLFRRAGVQSNIRDFLTNKLALKQTSAKFGSGLSDFLGMCG